MAESEIVGPQSYDPATARDDDLARPIHRARVDKENLEVPIPLSIDRLKYLGKPTLLVERANQYGGFWRASFAHLVVVRRTRKRALVCLIQRNPNTRRFHQFLGLSAPSVTATLV